MAADIYEYTDAQGRTHQVDDLIKVPKDRLKHMLVIGGEDAPPATTATTAAPPPKAAAGNAPMGIPQDAWAVSAFLMAVGIFNKRFMLRVLCIAVSIIWLLYNGYDAFMASGLSKTAEKEKKKPKPQVEQAEE